MQNPENPQEPIPQSSPQPKIIEAEPVLNPENGNPENPENQNQEGQFDINSYDLTKNFQGVYHPTVRFPTSLIPTMENNTKDQFPKYPLSENQKIPNIHGEKTMVCWNCASVLMVKDEWSVVKCTNCGKINRVPGTEDNVDSAIRLNDNMNHFDLYVPYVYAVITCPFCQTENKVRKDAEHIVCFQCHNSYNIQKEPWENYCPKKDNKEYPVVENPPIVNKCESCHGCGKCNGCNNDETTKLLKKLIKQLDRNPKTKIQLLPDRYKPLRDLVRDVDEMGGAKVGGKENYYNLFRKGVSYNNNDLGVGNINYRRKRKIVNYNRNNNFNDNYRDKPISLRSDINDGDYNDMESLKKKLYSEIRNDPKYSDIYKGQVNNMSRPRSFNNIYDKKKYYGGNPKNDAVYNVMFNSDLKKSYDHAAPNPQQFKEDSKNYDRDDIRSKTTQLYGGITFDYN